MDDDYPGTEELELRLQAYASARLAIRRGAAARMRAALVEEARMRALAATLGRPRGGRGGRVQRRVATVLLAAGLAISSLAGIAAASSAGGPLYVARIWLETVTLPADASVRTQERIHQIDERVLEVERAIGSGDTNAVSAATDAYREAVDEALGDAGTDAGRLTHLRAALGLHVGVLETLAGKVPGRATQAIDRAIDSSNKAVDRIDQANPDHGKPSPANRPKDTQQP